MTKRLVACNPIVSQTYRLGASASAPSCCALLRRSEVAFWPSVILCVCLSGFKTTSVCDKELQLAPLTSLQHSRLSLHTVQCVRARVIPARVRFDKMRTCRHWLCLPRNPEQFNHVGTVPPAYPVPLRYPLIILNTVERFDEWQQITH
jgi:hypothetical protein